MVIIKEYNTVDTFWKKLKLLQQKKIIFPKLLIYFHIFCSMLFHFTVKCCQIFRYYFLKHQGFPLFVNFKYKSRINTGAYTIMSIDWIQNFQATKTWWKLSLRLSKIKFILHSIHSINPVTLFTNGAFFLANKMQI